MVFRGSEKETGKVYGLASENLGSSPPTAAPLLLLFRKCRLGDSQDEKPGQLHSAKALLQTITAAHQWLPCKEVSNTCSPSTGSCAAIWKALASSIFRIYQKTTTTSLPSKP